MVVRGVMCQWWLAHWRVLGMCVVDAGQWIGCFAWLLWCGNVDGALCVSGGWHVGGVTGVCCLRRG